MELTQEETKLINEYKQKETDKINRLNISDEAKKDRLEILNNQEYHKLIPMRVKEVAPRQWEAY